MKFLEIRTDRIFNNLIEQNQKLAADFVLKQSKIVSRAQSPMSSVKSPESSAQSPAFRVQSLVSRVQRPASRAQRLGSNVQLLCPESRNSGMPIFSLKERKLKTERKFFSIYIPFYSPHSHPCSPYSHPNSPHSHPYSPHSHPDSLHSHPDSPHYYPDSSHSNPDSPHSHQDSPHSHLDSPRSHYSPHSVPRFPIPGFTDRLLRLIHNEYTWECNRKLKKKSPEMNIVHITQIININSRKKIMYRFAETFDGIMKSNCPSYEKFKNLY